MYKANLLQTTLNLTSLGSYKHSSLALLQSKLKAFFGNQAFDLSLIKDNLAGINVYPYLDSLQPLQTSEIFVLDTLSIENAEKKVLEGTCFWEHAAAGEGTRLGLGTKYTIDLSKYSKDEILQWITDEATSTGAFSTSWSEEVFSRLRDPKSLLSLSLGIRHMLQLVYELKKLATKYQLEPEQVMGRQKMLVILNNETASTIIDEFHRYHFLSFNPVNIYFMVQDSFSGIFLKEGVLFYDEQKDNKRLHNHGQMVMQKLHENSIFHFVDGEKIFLSPQEYLELMDKHDVMVSYNIEDTTYLTGAIDYSALTLALQLGIQEYEMVMEIVGQNRLKPQRGGAAFYDPILKKNIMVESMCLGNYDLSAIHYLNKNCNYYPHPARSLRAVRQQGLPMPITIKKGNDGKEYIYFCPPQGDINFLVKTAFVVRKELKPIQNWKSPITVIPTIEAMQQQDGQPGFKELAQGLGIL